jgi:hypothetical protein
MATQFRIGQVIDQLLVLSRALSGHRDPDGTDSTAGLVTVYDGPQVRSTDDAIDSTFLVIGYGGDGPDDISTAGSGRWSSGPIAGTVRPRSEVASVSCKIVSHRGESPKLARDAALAELNAVAGICRSDPSLGIDTSSTIGGVRTLAYVTGGQMVQYLRRGFVCEITFDITYDARV